MKTHLVFIKSSLIFAFLLLFLDVNSQNFGGCAYFDDTLTSEAPESGCFNSSDTWINKYRTPEYWIPDENTPIKTILVNWIVCRDKNGDNGWQDIPEFHDQVDLMFSHINEWYSNSQPKGYSLTCEPNYTHIYDTKIRFELNEIIFIDNTAFNTSCQAGNILDYVYQNYPDSKYALNHIFTMPPSQCYGNAWGYYSTYGNNAYVQTWYSMFSDWWVVWDDHIAHIAHEYGHAVGLHHTYDGEYTDISHYDFLDDIFGLCAEPLMMDPENPCFDLCGEPGQPCPCEPTPNHICYFESNCFFSNFPEPYPLMSGYNNSRYISPKAAGRMHRALSLYENNFVVGNKPMHKYVKEDHSFSIPLTINEDETWDFAIKMYQDIVIETGNTLTISCEVKMPIDGKIIVKQGGHLIVDGGHITSAHILPWQGIQVWGNRNSSQYNLPGQTLNQGMVILKNGATIENAICALDVWKPGDYSSTGGIVIATDAHFINNTQAVHALYYRNFDPANPSQELDCRSTFKNCTFEINDNYIGDNTFFKHVDLAHIKGFKFYGCDFSVDDQVAVVSTWNHAIAGYDAKFSVAAICNSTQSPCPENDYDKCTFTGFYNAISAVNDGGSEVSFSVNRADFIDNNYGVKTRDMNNASVLFSDFEIGFLWECGAGIYSDNVSGFAFEENDFSKYQGGPTGNYFGIIINNSEAVNEVYKNNFNGLSYANFSDGKNWERISRYKGLAYYCNENTNNYADFYVADYIPPDHHSGIQSEQGNNNHTAGNTFSQDGATWHFYNGGEHLVGYYYNQNANNQIPDDDKIYHVAKVGRSVNNTCPSHYGGNPQRKLVLSTQQKTVAEQDYYTNLTNYNNVKTLYNSFVDGGNPEGEKLDIQTAQPDDMWALRAQLLGDSPHLSMEILKEVADKTDVFSESALFDILAANPDELKKEELIKYLEEKENPLPEYMVSILRQMAEGTTYKTVLQQQMASYSHAYSRAANDIIRSILNDTVVNHTELRNWLNNLGGIAADRQIISSYVSEGNFTDAFTLANMLPQLYELKDNDLVEHNYFMDMLNLQQTLVQQGRNTYQMDDNEKAAIVLIANNSKGIAGAQAKSILEAVYNDYYVDCPDADGAASQKSGSAINPDALGKAFGLNISVKPNPARQWAAFDYTLPGDETEATITISSTTGSIIEILEVNGQQGQKLWDTRSIKPGMYIYTLKTSSFSQSGKIIISK